MSVSRLFGDVSAATTLGFSRRNFPELMVVHWSSANFKTKIILH